MNGNTQGFVLNQQNPTGMSLATLPAINFGANPVSFHVDKPWVIPDPGAMPSSALKGAVGDVINKALAGYQKRQAEKKKEDSDSTKDWMEWQKFEESQKHNIALENAAMTRAKATLPKGGVGPGAEGDLILKDILRGGETRSEGGQTVQDDTTSAEQPSGWLGDPDNPDEADDGETVLKMGAAPAPGDAVQSSRPVRDSRYTRDAKPNPGVTVRGTSANTDAQLKQFSDLPSGDQGADEVGLIPGLDDQAIFNKSLADMGGIPPRVEAVIPRPGQMAAQAPTQAAAPITEAIKGAAQEPLSMAGAPMPGASAIVGQAPAMSGSAPIDPSVIKGYVGSPELDPKNSPFAGKQLPVFVSAANAPAALAFIKAYNANPSDPNMVARGLAPINKAGDVQIQWENIGEKNKALKVQQEERKAKSDLASSEKTARIAFREGNSLLASQEVKNYQASSGLRQGLAKFIPGYVEGEKHPQQRGATDMDLLDNYIRAMSGGKPTEAQIHLVTEARSLKEKGQTWWNKLTGGDILSQGQRDQFTRSLLDAHNSTASMANQPMIQVRERMMDEGVKNEKYLPHPYVDYLILKKDAIIKKNELAGQAIKLNIKEYQEALKSGDKDEIKAVEDKIRELNQEAKELSDRLKHEKLSGHPVLGWKDFEKKRQGFVAGSMGFQYHGASAGFDGNSEPAANVSIQAPLF